MRAIAFLRRRWPEVAWAAFAIANFVAMGIWPGWETIPFHFVWISLTLLYGFRVWRQAATYLTLLAVVTVTGGPILQDAFSGDQLWGELFEVPLMSAMFLAMVWHARRRPEALGIVERQATQRESLLQRPERVLHDASHELRTPVTIARGHLEARELVRRDAAPQVAVARDGLARHERIREPPLPLSKARGDGLLALHGAEGRPVVVGV